MKAEQEYATIYKTISMLNISEKDKRNALDEFIDSRVSHWLKIKELSKKDWI